MVAYVLLSYSILTLASEYPNANDQSPCAVDPASLNHIPGFVVEAPKTHSSKYFPSSKRPRIAHNPKGYVQLSVFKGREAKLNHAIILALCLKEPQTTRALFKTIIHIKNLKDTSYATVNKRVRSLETLGYLKKAQTKQRPGGLTNYYELHPRAYLIKFFATTSIDELIKQTNDETALVMYATLMGTKEPEKNHNFG